MKDDDTSGFQFLDDRARAIPSSLDDFDTLIDSNLGICAIIGGVHGWQKGDIDTERLVGHGLAFSDFFSQIFGGWLCECSDDSKSTGVTDCGRQFCVSYPLHTALDNRDCEWQTLVKPIGLTAVAIERTFDAQSSRQLGVERHFA
jgi:hypothetical protein